MRDAAAAPEPPLLERLRAANPLPEGTASVGIGLAVNGLGAYLFLSLAGRGLGPDAFTPLSVMWALSFAAAPGLFLPLEQEVSRAVASRRARGVGAGPVVRQAALIGIVLLAAVLVLTIATLPWSHSALFDDQTLLVVGFMMTLAGYALAHPVRGLLSGHGRFFDYAVYFGAEGLLRVVVALVLLVVGVTTAGPYGLLLGVVPFVATGAALCRPVRLVEPGPPSRVSEVSASFGALLAASLFTAFLLNAGPIAVDLLATDAESDQAGRFLAGLVIARVPLFLFQAVQASLLPRLSHLAGGRQWEEFRDALRRLLLVVIAIGLVGTIAAWTVGPIVVRVLFGPEFDLGHRDLGLLAVSSGCFMVAVALGQSLIALSSQTRLAVAWAFGSAAFVVATALGGDLYLRVEIGLVIGTVAVVGVLAVILLSELSAVTPDPAD